ncbi:MAG: S8 family serine peptidase, partial [Acidobacteriia bacterium]|nr:S8 family serine peptidase [Terriglobia bacterium]
MNSLLVMLVLVLRAWGQEVPGLFIVEMDAPPKSASLQAVRQAAMEKAGMRQAIEQRGEVISSIDEVMNALVVKTGGTMEDLASIAGVRKVYKVFEVKLELDHSLPLARVPEAWEKMGGMENAGLGIKIAIIDTGIDFEHPGFQDDSLATPEGFPKGNRESDLAAANKKIIVARSYENLLAEAGQPSPRDTTGHGTGVAMVAAGVRHQAPLGEISGVAPKAFLGNYKVFSEGSTRTDVIIRAIDDAVKDGMDVINLSLGLSPAQRPEDDALVRAVERAIEAGVIVVKSMGNEGPNPQTGTSPGAANGVITAGSHSNDRWLIATVTLPEMAPIPGVPADAPLLVEPLTGPVVDVEALDLDGGLACLPLPEGSLAGKIALILRGVCLFEVKLTNATNAGAIGAVMYTDDRPVAVMSIGEASLPAMMVLNEDGLKIKQRLAEQAGVTAELRFRGGVFPVNPNEVSPFSSRGPSEFNGIQPDVLAVGEEVYTAAQKTDPRGDLYGEDGYTIVDGTSFSSPMVAGAAAVVKGARPKLTQRQYRSLLINGARPLVLANEQTAPVQQAGAGILNLANSVSLTATAFPASLSFGASGGTATVTRPLTITNAGTAEDTFSLTAGPFGESPAPQLAMTSMTLAAGASRTIDVVWSVSDLAAGAYQGVVNVRGTANDSQLRIPYWYAVRSPNPGFITLFRIPASASVSGTATFFLRITDPSGVILNEVDPEVTADIGDGSVQSIQSIDEQYPGLWQVRLRMGPLPG